MIGSLTSNRDGGVDYQTASVVGRVVTLASITDHARNFIANNRIREFHGQPSKQIEIVIQQRLVNSCIAKLPVEGPSGRAKSIENSGGSLDS